MGRRLVKERNEREEIEFGRCEGFRVFGVRRNGRRVFM